jgi:hypothetical protein
VRLRRARSALEGKRCRPSAEDTGDLTDIQYRIGGNPDPDTPDVNFAYNRLGQKATVTDAVTGPTGARTFTYRERKRGRESFKCSEAGDVGTEPW